MKRIPQSPRSRRRKEAGHFLAIIAVLFGCLLLIAIAAPPAWWATRGVTNTNAADDYAALNQGQLKNLVRGAVQEMDEHLPGGAGDALHQLVSAWTAPTSKTDDYAAVNLGQLKAVVKRVYDRFQQEGLVTGYPWDNSAFAPDDYAMAAIGQAKNLFAFDLVAGRFDAYHAPGGDGIPYRWKLQHGLDPSNPNLASQMAPGGLTYLDKYRLGLNPLVADTDGDGVADGQDRFPSDPRRSDYIPAKFYAVTDLSAYLPANVKASFEAEQIAIDDNHTVAFFGTSNGGATGHTYQWQNGNLTPTSQFDMVTPPDRSGTPMTSQDLEKFGIADGGTGTGGTLVSELTVNSINSSGTLAMSASTSYMAWYVYPEPPYPWGNPGPWFAGQGSVSYGTNEWPITQVPWPGGWIPDGFDVRDPTNLAAGATIAVDNAGYKLAWDLDWALSDPLDPGSGYYRYRTLFGEPGAEMQEIPALSEGSTVFANVDAYFLNCYGLNNHGAFLVKGPVYNYASHYTMRLAYKYCEAGTLHNAPDGILQMNDQHQAIGETYGSGEGLNGWFGFKISSENWDTMPVLDLLKWTNKPPGTRDDWDKFHNQLRNVRPKFITGVDPGTVGVGIVIAGKSFPNGVPRYIQFAAYFADDPPDDHTTTGTWTPGDFVLEFDRSDLDPLSWHYKLKTIWTSPGCGAAEPVAMNTSGSMVAFMHSEGDDDGKRLAILDGFEFTVDESNKSSFLAGAVGFDPPINGDGKPEMIRTGKPETDSMERVYWTSVCKTSTVREAVWMDGGKYPELNINKAITAKFDDAGAAAGYELHIMPNRFGVLLGDLKIGLATKIGLPVLPDADKIEVLEKETNFWIRGLNPEYMAGFKTIREIRLIGKGQGQVDERTPKLMVAILPERRLTLGISFVQDERHEATKIWNAANLAKISLKAVLREVCTGFQQACVTFDSLPDNNQRVTDIAFDFDPQDGYLNYNDLGSKKEEILLKKKLPKSDVRIAFFKNIANWASVVRIIGITPPIDKMSEIGIETVIKNGKPGEDNKFLRWVAAHEVGHGLGLSTRNPPNHDNGPFPKWLGVTNSLMTSGDVMDKSGLAYNQEGASVRRSAWLRHEDWIQANNFAADIIEKRKP